MAEAAKWLKLTRTFDAPIEVVWSMWTDPALFRQWYGPNGMRVPVAEIEASIGGKRKICMERSMPQGSMTLWFTGVHLEVSRPTRLVYTEAMCDAEGTLIAPQMAGMPAGQPQITQVIVDLRAEEGRTVMTMVHAGLAEGTAAEGGWAQAFDKLAARLAQAG